MVVEHRFLGDLLIEYWKRNWPDRIEVSKPEVDNAGYDLVLEARGKVRHVQLKSSVGTAGVVPINRLLESKPAGCVIWMGIDPHLEIQEYRWLGSEGGLPPVSGFGKPSGKTHRVPLGKFERLAGLQEVMARLFG